MKINRLARNPAPGHPVHKIQISPRMVAISVGYRHPRPAPFRANADSMQPPAINLQKIVQCLHVNPADLYNL
jgi:hypothetical protein